MQISRTLMRSKVGSLHFRRRLSVILVIILLVVVIALWTFQGFSQVTVAGDEIGDSYGATGGSGDPLLVTPEYGFTGGGVIALAICFVAFALFVKRGKLLDKNIP